MSSGKTDPSRPSPSAPAAGMPPLDAGLQLGNLLRQALTAGLDGVDARILIGHALGLSRIELITRSEYRLTEEQARTVETLLRRRLAGEPVAYLIGTREFYGLQLAVTPDVLIPRPETELLVDLALEHLPATRLRVLDLGTGSGAIAIALACTRPDLLVTAVDISDAALNVARANAARHAGHAPHLAFHRTDWYNGLDSGATFDLIVSNPPYIAAGDCHLHTGDLRFEPTAALTDGADGLSAVRAILAGAHRRLVPGGWLLMEHGYDQAAAVRDLLGNHGFARAQSWRDLAGIERVSGGQRN